VILNGKDKTMTKYLAALVLGLAAFAVTSEAPAAPLTYTKNAPVIDLPVVTTDYLETFGFGDLSFIFAEGLASGTAQAGDLFVTLTLGFDPVTPAGTELGALTSEDDNGGFLDGDVLTTGFDGDVLQVVFGNLSGTAAPDFGRFALLELTFIDPFPGTNPLVNLVDGVTYDAFATIYSATPIPLPAALPLMGAALGGLVLLRRRR